MQPASATTSFSIPAKRPQILCVDSDAPGLVLLDAILAPRGYDAARATSAKEALDILARQPIDLILLGSILPGVDGFTVCLQLRAHECFRDLPIVMMSAIKSREDFIRGIEAGADDLLFKPLDHDMMLARIKMLIARKKGRDRLSFLHADALSLTQSGMQIVEGIRENPFDVPAEIEKMVSRLVRRTTDAPEKPRTVIVGLASSGSTWQWHHFEYTFHELGRVTLNFSPITGVEVSDKSKAKMFLLTGPFPPPEARVLIKNFQARNIAVDNGIAYLSADLCVLAVNYATDVGEDHLAIVRQLVLQSRFLSLLTRQYREVDLAFDYGVYALARAAEVHDDDPGQHALRIGDYCGVLAERLGLNPHFVKTITVQAALHDVGKIYTPQAILRKTEPLSAEEWGEMRKHTLWGAKIIGGNPHLHIAQSIALNHHEKWDGTGYPRGLKGEAIPIEGRIALLADQYDTLRMDRAHKPALDHAAVTKILNHGDGRTLPRHFDPQVLKAFRETAFLFEDIFERRKG